MSCSSSYHKIAEARGLSPLNFNQLLLMWDLKPHILGIKKQECYWLHNNEQNEQQSDCTWVIKIIASGKHEESFR